MSPDQMRERLRELAHEIGGPGFWESGPERTHPVCLEYTRLRRALDKLT